MKLLPGADGRLDYDGISGCETVQDLLDAVDVYLERTPLPCFTCDESCCRKHWAVEADNVFVRRLTGGDEEAADRFVGQKLKLKLNHSMEFNQYVLDKEKDCPYIGKDSRCSVYGIRPVICRLYVCSPRSRRYDLLRGAVAAVYLQALVTERKLRQSGPAKKAPARYLSNPALGAADYSLGLREIIAYATRQGWLEEEDAAELQ